MATRSEPQKRAHSSHAHISYVIQFSAHTKLFKLFRSCPNPPASLSSLRFSIPQNQLTPGGQGQLATLYSVIGHLCCLFAAESDLHLETCTIYGHRFCRIDRIRGVQLQVAPFGSSTTPVPTRSLLFLPEIAVLVSNKRRIIYRRSDARLVLSVLYSSP